jgi:hypothetical protein
MHSQPRLCGKELEPAHEVLGRVIEDQRYVKLRSPR